MSALSLLSGVKRKSGLRAVRSVVGPISDIDGPAIFLHCGAAVTVQSCSSLYY
jgi:hypothetical protein